MSRPGLLFVALALVLPSSVLGTEIYDLKINEVCPVLVQGIVEDDPGAWFELYNPLQSNVSTAGVSMTDADMNLLAELPMIVLPPGGYLLVQMGVGVDDLDGSDGVAVFNVGRTEGLTMPWTAEAVAVFRGPIGVVENIRDFVAWGTQPLDGSTALNLAIARGIWRDGAFVDLGGVRTGSSFGLAVAGLDSDENSPWAFFSGRYDSGIQTPGAENILMAFPHPGEVFFDEAANGILPAAWVGTEFPGEPTSYLVELNLANNNGDWDTIYSEETPETNTDLPNPSGGEYSWTVTPCVNGTPLSEVLEYHFYRPVDVGEHAELEIEFLECLKDTKMLCSYDLANGTRPGCDQAMWNFPHTPGNTNAHDTYYSARAAIAMINNFFGGDLSQDRISYQNFRNRYPGAEGDLGHGVGFRTVDVTAILRWALGGIQTNYAPYAPPFDHIRSEIDAGHPVLVATTPGGNNREGAVISGYANITLYENCPPMPSVRVLDPRSGTPYWILYSFFSPRIGGHWQITGTPVGITQEANVLIDGDEDGVIGFDETPENDRFACSESSPDSDGDLVSDFAEIFCYTFHDLMHPEHNNDAPGFADIDGDGLRAEIDTDSDNGSWADGLEDVDHDGFAPEEGETCPHMPSDDGTLPSDPATAGDGSRNLSHLRLARIAGDGGVGCRFRIDLPQSDQVSLRLLTIHGREVANMADRFLAAGSHEVVWNGYDGGGDQVASGLYLVHLTTGQQGNRAAKLVYFR